MHLESVSKRGIGRKDLVFTSRAGGWTGTIEYTVTGSKTTVDEGAGESGSYRNVETWEVDAEGSIQLGRARMGAEFGMLVVTGGTVTWRQRHVLERTARTRMGDCTYEGSSRFETVASGSAPAKTDELASMVVAGDRGQLFASTIAGTIPSRRTGNGSGSVSGPGTCREPDPFVPVDEEGEHGILPEVLQLMGPLDPERPDTFAGSTTFVRPGLPDLEYTATWNLQKR